MMNKRQKKWLRRIIISLSLFILVFVSDLIFSLDEIIPGTYGFILPLVLYLIIYLLIGYDVILKAIRNIFNGHIFDENFLMLIATITAFFIGEFSEACAVILFYQVGEFFQNYAVNKSRNSITELMNLRPDYANLLNSDGSTREVDPEEVKIEDIILVKPGEKVPLDGIIVSGETLIDTKALTGESLPVNKNSGDEILSGVINLSGLIEVKVTKEFYDSTVNKILELVENAQAKKSKSEKFITQFSKFYTPIVVILALLLAIIPGLITGMWPEWVYRSLNFLVVSCPCAVVISVPLSFFSALGACSKKGILIKGSNYLEQMSKANIFVLDKTGTLTKGNFKVKKIMTEHPEQEVLEKAAICEKNISHPIALSIIEEYKKYTNCDLPDYEIENIPGYGVVAKGEEEMLFVGNEKLMEKYQIKTPKITLIGTVVYVAKNNNYLGAILIGDEIKEKSFEFIGELNKLSLKSIMLSGDNELVCGEVASTLNISKYHSSLLPHDKISHLEDIINNKGKNDVVCFIGDGINDAPSITRSDVGISMGQVGSDAAIEASDIVIMNDDLTEIIKVKKISLNTMNIVKSNIIFALGVKLIVLILSAFGIANMWMSVFADVGVAVLAIINATRSGKSI